MVYVSRLGSSDATEASDTSYDCAVLGDWHLAFVTATCLATLGHRILLVNPNPRGLTEFPECPVNEPTLPELMAETKAKGLLAYLEITDKTWSARSIWLA